MSWIHTEDTKPKARKNHICELCGQSIPVGTKHIARSGFIEREGPITIRLHMDCEHYTSVNLWDDGDWESADTSGFREVINARLPIPNQSLTNP